jgi:hypothetical protein
MWLNHYIKCVIIIKHNRIENDVFEDEEDEFEE